MPASCTSVDASPALLSNQLLRALPGPEFERVRAALDECDVSARTVLLRRDEESAHVYFPVSAVVSLVTHLADGRTVEAAAVGREGLLGIHSVIESPVALQDAVVQLPGRVARMPVGVLRDEIARGETLSRLARRYVRALIMQLGNLSACNRLHSVRQRTCRWLLSVHDRADRDELAITQEALAMALGVRRAGISEVMRWLCESGGAEHRPGVIKIRNRAPFEAAACECYHAERELLAGVFA